MLNESRSDAHKRNSETELVLSELETLLGTEPTRYQVGKDQSHLPTIYIVGCARCGSTVAHQLLIQMLDVCYPSNLLSRFYYAPYTGALIQKLMTDLDLKGELLGSDSSVSLSSVLGKTKGALSPNEFWYYWRKHFTMRDSGYIQNPSAKELDEFMDGLNSLKRVFAKPLLLKGMIANNCIADIANSGNNQVVIHVKRKLSNNAYSLIKARREYYNDVEKWYSFEVPNQSTLKHLNPYEQVVFQVAETNALINKQLLNIPKAQVFTINYEDMTSQIPTMANAISNNYGVDLKEEMSNGFNYSSKMNNQDSDWVQVNEAIEKHISGLRNPYI